ncbi:hypothetical protein B0H13DRAFT_1879354 [Mycena leptocephala]|nr:hypothetical protein B0H13DRAFT_1879354 [Mycena leptocephala]
MCTYWGFSFKSTGGRAQGYSHTYYDNTGANLPTLAVYPPDADIAAAAEVASAECDALVSLLGLVPEQLHRKQSAALPSISAWFSEDEDVDQDEEFDDIDENRPSEAEELQALVDEQERSDVPLHGPRVAREIMSLICASIALSADDHMRVQQFQQMNKEEFDGVLGEEYLTLQKTITGLAAQPDAVALSPVQIPDELSVTMPESEESMHRQILRKFHEILKESDQTRAPGTTVERQARWNIGSSTGTGNAANAAAVASAEFLKLHFVVDVSDVLI